jgi:hypothetical protein
MKIMKKTFLVLSISLVCLACSQKPTDDLEMLEGIQGFQMSDNLTCTILTSTDVTKQGESFSFLSVETQEPKIFWTDKKIFFDLEKIHDGMNLLGLRYVNNDKKLADTYLLNTQTGLFALKRVGLGIPKEGIISKGQCE